MKYPSPWQLTRERKRLSFACLKCAETKPYKYCRRDDGETILHCAIAGEYFELAFTIIHLFPMLVNSVNERGLSPLHLLANKPNAFRSGTHLSWIDKIIYYCKNCPTKTQLLKIANKLQGMPRTAI